MAVDSKGVKDQSSFYGEYSSSCIWGDWGGYAACEIITNVCKRLRFCVHVKLLRGFRK